jgi:ribosomal protein S18 acetylase RimI-like enzyme
VIQVRPAHEDEYERVGTLTVAAYRLLPVDHLFGGYDDGILDTAGRAKGAELLVAVDAARVIGAVTYVADSSSPWSEWTEPGEAQFRLLAVDADARGRGAGEALARACVTRAAASNQRLIIHTTQWMEPARRMYDRLGFTRRPDRDVPYEVWNDPPVAELPDEWRGESFLAYSKEAP